MQRRHRLSRSRDFEAVYRHGTSVSSRYLVLHSFPREDGPAAPPRLGLAVPKSVGSSVTRNRVKRVLREVWRGMLDEIPPGRDYVLSARPGLAELTDSRDRAWLEQEVAEIVSRVRA